MSTSNLTSVYIVIMKVIFNNYYDSDSTSAIRSIMPIDVSVLYQSWCQCAHCIPAY